MTGLPTLEPEIADLGVALGLLTPSPSGVEFDSTWFDSPGTHLSGALGDTDRRNALVRFADTVIGEGQHDESGGITYLHLFDLRTLAANNTLPDITVQVSLDANPASYVEIGIAVSVATGNPATATRAVIPLYRAAKKNQHVAQPFALLDGGVVQLSTDLTFSATAPATDEFGLQGVSVSVATALTNNPAPSFSLVLKGLHLPGAAQSHDVPIGAPGANIEQTLLSLVLGLVRQAAEALSGQAAADAGAALSLLGLSDGSQVPSLPVADLVEHGADKLRDWFVGVMGDAAARGHWLQALADLLGGTVANGLVQVQIGGSPVHIEIGLGATTGASGHLMVTPTLGLNVGLDVAGAIHLAAEAKADLLTIDTSTGALTPVPDVEIAVTAMGNGAGNAALLLHTQHLDVGSVRLGLAVRNGTPQALVQALNVSLDGHTQDVVDLSTPDAVVAELGQVASTLIGDLLDSLGAASANLKGLLGIVATGGMPALDGALLLTNPLGTLADWWNDLLTNHKADIPAVLQLLRDLIAAPLQANVPLTIVDPNVGPWSIPVAPRVTLDVSLADGKVLVEPVLSLRVDDLAGGCTVVLTELRTTLASFDLVNKHAQFPLAVSLTAKLRARGASYARLALGAFAIVADYLGVQAAWSPGTPFSFGFAAPGLGVDTGPVVIPLVLPTVDAHGHIAVPAAAWGSVEMLVGVLAAQANQSWLSDVVDLVGWRIGVPPRGPKLSLAAVAANPAVAFKAWLGALATDANLVATLTSTLAHITGGSSDGLAGVFSGTGTPDDPWLASLGGSASLPAIAVWMTPHGPVLAPSLAGQALTAWRPGAPGLPPAGLAGALFDEARAGADVAALAAHREGIDAGLTALAGRWTGTDGLVAPPPAPVSGLTTVSRPDLDWTGLAALDLTQVVPGALAPVVVRVAVSAVIDLPWTPAAGRLLDLTQPGIAPASFTVSTPATGEWVVALAPRSDATLGGTADPTGIVGQSQRLIQVLQQLAGAGQITLVAIGGAGHAARLAADQVGGVTQLVTLGTPWSGVTFDSARTGVPADALRLMKALLPDVHDSDDDDLRRAKALVTGMFEATRRTPRSTDLEAPLPTTTVRNGLAAYGVLGVLSEGAVLRAMTACFAAGLAERAQARVAAAAAQPDATHVGVRVPFSFLTPPGGHGTTLSGAVLLTLGSVRRSDASVSVSPAIGLDFSIADTDGWLVGGPGTTPVGGALPLELRHVTGHVSIGLHGQPSEAHLVLNEGAALGSDWVSILVEPPTQATGELELQPLLPEAQALLSALATKLSGAVPASPAGLFAALLNAAGVTQAGGALEPDALVHLLHDP